MSEPEPKISPLSPELPDWGVYLRWPKDGHDWIHPSDLELAEQLIPSRRIFRRSRWDGSHYWLNYGKHCLRVAPTLWLSVSKLDLEVGQQVELLSRHGENDSGIFRIRDILFCEVTQEAEYFLMRGEVRLSRQFKRRDLKPLQVQHHLRSGFYRHQAPGYQRRPGAEALDVGDLTDQ